MCITCVNSHSTKCNRIGLQKDVQEWSRSCVPCQTTKVHYHNKTPIGNADAEALLLFLTETRPLSPSWHGFRPYLSNLVPQEERVTRLLDKGHTVD